MVLGLLLLPLLLGKIIDLGIKDVNNMGAAMAGAAEDTLIRHFEDTGTNPSDYDAIFTGDLGYIGKDILIDLTSLLDVIFILLMVVLARQQITKMDLDSERVRFAEEEAALKELTEETEEKYKLYTDQTDMAKKVVIMF